jgi:hypothetical protein
VKPPATIYEPPIISRPSTNQASTSAGGRQGWKESHLPSPVESEGSLGEEEEGRELYITVSRSMVISLVAGLSRPATILARRRTPMQQCYINSHSSSAMMPTASNTYSASAALTLPSTVSPRPYPSSPPLRLSYNAGNP